MIGKICRKYLVQYPRRPESYYWELNHFPLRGMDVAVGSRERDSKLTKTTDVQSTKGNYFLKF